MLALVFRIGAERFALPCKVLVEVVPRVELRPIAHAPDYVAGVFVLRGAAVPVIDLCQLIAGVPCSDRLSSRIMLVTLGGQVLGLLAENVTEAIDLTRKAAAISVPAAPYLGELYGDGQGGAMVQLLDVGQLLSESLQQRLLVGAS